jgi:hypothetical protein
VIALAVVLLAAAGEDAAGVAKRYLDLMAAGKTAEAAALTTGGARVEPQLKQAQRFLFAPPGAKKAEAGALLWSGASGLHALALFEHTLHVDPAQAKRHSADHAARIAEDFPEDQRAAAAKVIRWSESRFVKVLPVYLVWSGNAWKVDFKGEGFPLREFRGPLKKKFGANLLRWAGEDGGDPGCHDPRDKEGRCYSNEDEPPGPAGPRCYLASGKPCPEGVECMMPADDPRPCKKGEQGCFTIEGEDCVLK